MRPWIERAILRLSIVIRTCTLNANSLLEEWTGDRYGSVSTQKDGRTTANEVNAGVMRYVARFQAASGDCHTLETFHLQAES